MIHELVWCGDVGLQKDGIAADTAATTIVSAVSDG